VSVHLKISYLQKPIVQFKVIAESLVEEFLEWSLTATSGDALSIQILKTISQGEIDYEIAN